jgi:hypothetical protein
MDGGSNPPSSTNTLKANPNRLAFFCLLPRVYAGSCGFLRTAERGISASNRQVLLGGNSQLLEWAVFSDKVFRLFVASEQLDDQFVAYGHGSSFWMFGSFLPFDRSLKI